MTGSCLIGVYRAFGHHLAVQQHYFGVASFKIRSEFSDHSDPFDKLAVEGRKLICKTAAGSGVSLCLRPVGGLSSFCVELHPGKTVKVSATRSIAGRLALCEGFGIPLCTGRVRGVFVGGLVVFGAGLTHRPQALIALLQAHIGYGRIHAGILEDPDTSGGGQGHGQVGGEGEAHGALPATDSAHRDSGTFPTRWSTQPTTNVGMFRAV